jgi:hypothetical protein
VNSRNMPLVSGSTDIPAEAGCAAVRQVASRSVSTTEALLLLDILGLNPLDGAPLRLRTATLATATAQSPA